MSANQRSTILRSFRHMPPSKFHAFNQKVRKGLTDNVRIPESTWGPNRTLLPSYLSASEKHDALYHQAIYGHKLHIAERDLLQAQIITYLDEIALILESAAFRNPEILLVSGFDLAKERRGRARTTVAQSVSEPLEASNEQPSS